MSEEKELEKIIGNAKTADSEELLELIDRVIDILDKEQEAAKSGRLIHLPSSGKITIIGDLHGDLEGLIHILKESHFLKDAQKGVDVRLVFLGDYGDRGLASPEVYYIILKLKELFLNKVVLLRGNHEGPIDLQPYPHELPRQLQQKYGHEDGAKIYSQLRNLFDFLYIICLINDRAVLIHGGFPNKAQSISDLAYACKNHPKESVLEEMLWSDPKEKLIGVQRSTRGAGNIFGADVTERLVKLLNVQVLIRGHETCKKGYKISHKGKVLTLFSTNKLPYKNKYAAYLQLNLSKQITNAKQLEKKIKQF